MVEVEEPVIVDRQKEFVPDEISLVNYVLSDYENPVAPEPRDYARKEFDKATDAIIEAMRRQRSEEANGQGLTGKAKGGYINLEIDKLKLERKNQRDEAVEKRTKELETEIPEGLKMLKKLSSLSTTTEDGKRIQDFMIKIFDTLPENVHLLATEADAK